MNFQGSPGQKREFHIQLFQNSGNYIQGDGVRIRFFATLFIMFNVIAFLFKTIDNVDVQAESSDAWWDESWPYRLSVTVDEEGVAAVNIDFSSVFAELGIEGALLDLRSIRVIPYQDGTAGEPMSYQETYSELLIDGDTLEQDPASGLPYWEADELFSLSTDEERLTQGSGSLHVQFQFVSNSNSSTGFYYYMNDPDLGDWSDYETLIYDVWPQVNEEALDQTTDLYYFKLEGLGNCVSDSVNGPALSMDEWNHVSVSLSPFGNCAYPDASTLDSIYFYLGLASSVNDYGYDEGDELDLWLDNFRLVDQDGDGEIRWQTQSGVDRYYIYFDTLDHEGHPLPELTALGEGTSASEVGLAEAGGYFHQIAGAETGDLVVWNAPTSEKIFKTSAAPMNSDTLMIYAARREFEVIQIVVNSETTQQLTVSVSDLTFGNEVISASQVEVFRVDYVEITQLSDSFGRLGLWPDPLYPITSGEQVTFPAGENQPLWFRIEVPSNAEPGIYTGTIQIGSAVIPYTLNVWNFSLPQDSGLETRIGFDWYTVLEAYGGTVNGEPQQCYDQLVEAITETFEDYRLTPSAIGESGAPEDVLLYSLTDYEVAEAHTQQVQSGAEVWWEFTAYDRPPLANPAVMDRSGLDARLLPWLAWLDRVDGIYYYQSVDWDPDPWSESFSNLLSNGDGFLLYPPKDDTLGYDPCDPESNRLVPSIRLELLREGMEDYAYLSLLNGGEPEIDVENLSDLQAALFIDSRTSFSRIPTLIESVRSEIAGLLQGKQGKYYLPLILY